MKYIPLFEFLGLIIMVLIRSAILRKHGIKAIVFGITLNVFGKSFRVGIDENTTEKLITNGTFSISRNPIYLAFMTFFMGIFIAYPNITSSIGLIFIIAMIHRQILREEKFLNNHYGKEYEAYCNKVRRYI